MPKATPPSVTATRCTCAWLEHAARERTVPVRLDAKLGEYHLVYRDGGRSVLRHCPWCGGATPPSRRPPLFAPIPPAEQRRLERLIAGLITLAEVVERLGEPDVRARTGRHAELTYSRLSGAAVVTVTGLGRRGVLCSVVPRAPKPRP